MEASQIRSELYIKITKDIPNPIQNPSFTDPIVPSSSYAPDNWGTIFPVTNYTQNNNAIYPHPPTIIYQDDIINGIGNYKVSFKILPPLDLSIIDGGINILFGDQLYSNAYITVGDHTVYFSNVNVLDNSNLGIIFDFINDFNGGLTNVTLEKVDGVWEQVDLKSEIDLEFDYSIADVKDITKRSSGKSKSITLVGSKNNNNLFQNIYNASETGTFLMGIPCDCYVMQDGENIFTGNFILNNCIVTTGDVKTYSATIYSKFNDLVNRIGGDFIRGNDDPSKDLNFGEYSYYLTGSVVSSSLARPIFGCYTTGSNIVVNYGATSGSGVIHTMIDKGIIQSDGTTYIPHYDAAVAGFINNPNLFWIDEMTPCLFIKEIWDKIFQDAGYQYDSTFLNAEYFSKLIYPATDRFLNVDNALIDNSNSELYDAVNKNVQNFFSISAHEESSPYTDFSDDGTGLYPRFGTGSYPNDGLGWEVIQWNSAYVPPINNTYTLGEIVIGKKGFYSVNTNINYQLQLMFPNATADGLGNYNIGYNVFNTHLTPLVGNAAVATIRIYHKYPDGTQPSGFNTNDLGTAQPQNVNIPDVGNNMSNFQLDNTKTFTDPTLYNYSKALTAADAVFCNVGDTIGISLQLKIYCYSHNNHNWLWRNYNPNANSTPLSFVCLFPGYTENTNIFNVKMYDKIAEGMLVNPTDILHDKLPKIDFLNAIIKKFNLYIEDSGVHKFSIEPREMYYDNDVVPHQTLIWSDPTHPENNIMDVASVKTEPASDLYLKYLNFHDEADEDNFEILYRRANHTNKQYGEYWARNRYNRDINNVLEIKTIFSPTIVAPLYPNYSFDIPHIYLYNTDAFTLDVNKKYKPKILFWGGMITSSNASDQWQLGYEQTINTGSNSDYVPYTGSFYTFTGQYPFSSHLNTYRNNILSSDGIQRDLNWYSCESYFVNFLNSGSEDSNSGSVNTGKGQHLIGQYYQEELNTLTNTDVHLLTAKFNLKPTDIANIKFNDIVMIDKVPYYLNKINSYTYGQPTEVQLLRSLKSYITQFNQYIKNPSYPSVLVVQPQTNTLIGAITTLRNIKYLDPNENDTINWGNMILQKGSNLAIVDTNLIPYLSSGSIEIIGGV